ncbi:MAG: mechanosensitive ion channel family protein [Oscillospiraceae bacterium]|nr:mechanosensitive ion channel family protein [Oscillospiraceae bacterium]
MNENFFSLIITIAVTLVFCGLTMFLMNKFVRYKDGKDGGKIYRHFAHKILQCLIVFIGVVNIAYQVPVLQGPVRTILTSSGVLAIVFSLAAQESLTNLIDGVFITIFRPFNIGDRITLPERNNLTGVVTTMNLRHTVITTYNNTSYIIANSVMSTAIVENSNYHNETFAYPIDVTVSYESDIDLAMKIMAEVITSHPEYVDRRSEEEKKSDALPALVLVRELGDSGLSLRCQMVTKDVSRSFKACSDVRVNLKKAFDANGIVIPYTTLTVHTD